MRRVISSLSYGISGSWRKRDSGTSARSVWAATRSAAVEAAMPASWSPLRSGVALAIRSPRSPKVKVRWASVVENGMGGHLAGASITRQPDLLRALVQTRQFLYESVVDFAAFIDQPPDPGADGGRRALAGL